MTVKLETFADATRESIVQRVIERNLVCRLERYNPNDEFAELDYYAIRNGMRVAVIELKCRQTKSTDFPDVFLAVRKYQALMDAYRERRVLPFFVAAFADGCVYGINVMKLDPEWVTVVRRTKARESGQVGTNDTEMAFAVKIGDMALLGVMDDEERAAYTA